MAAGTKRPCRRTGSMVCGIPPQSSRVTHSFKVIGSSIHSGYGVGEAVRSASFSVGGHRWCIKYYPAGYAEDCKGYVSVFLHLVSTNAEATVVHDFRLVHQATGVSKQLNSCLTVFNDVERPSWGFRKFMKKTDFEARGYLKDDCLQIECDLAVIKVGKIEVPPPGLQDDLGKLPESKEGAEIQRDQS